MFFKLAVAALISLVSVNSMARDRIIQYAQLPQPAKAFIAAHFAGTQVSYVKFDDGKYELRMSDGSEVEFTGNGEWDNVDCEYRAVPKTVLALIPAEISKYVAANFPGASIVKIDKERFSIQIELDNDLELVFSKTGKFLRIDD